METKRKQNERRKRRCERTKKEDRRKRNATSALAQCKPTCLLFVIFTNKRHDTLYTSLSPRLDSVVPPGPCRWLCSSLNRRERKKREKREEEERERERERERESLSPLALIA